MPKRLSAADIERIRQEVRDAVGEGLKVLKVMRCGHEAWVLKSVDPAKADCWACAGITAAPDSRPPRRRTSD